MDREPGQNFIGSPVVALPAVAEGAGDGGKEGEEAQVLGFELTGEDEAAEELGLDDAIESVGGLVADELVFDHASAVDYAVKPTVLSVDRINERAERCLVAHVDLVIFDGARGAPRRF